jgi:hypothetical protein
MKAVRSNKWGLSSPAALMLLLAALVATVGDTRAFAPPMAASHPAHSLPAISRELTEDIKGSSLQRVLPFPFEVVFEAWTGGPPDPNFLKEEALEESEKDGEAVLKKLLYTKNPLPLVLRSTVVHTLPNSLASSTMRNHAGRLAASLQAIATVSSEPDKSPLQSDQVRDPHFIFEEEQRTNAKARYSKSWSVNRSWGGVVTARRSLRIQKHPENPEWTILEQAMDVQIGDSIIGSRMANQLEQFANGIFISTVSRSADELLASLHRKHPGGAEAPSAQQDLIDVVVSAQIKEQDRADAKSLALRGARRMGRALRRMAVAATSPAAVFAGVATRLVFAEKDELLGSWRDNGAETVQSGRGGLEGKAITPQGQAAPLRSTVRRARSTLQEERVAAAAAFANNVDLVQSLLV